MTTRGRRYWPAMEVGDPVVDEWWREVRERCGARVTFRDGHGVHVVESFDEVAELLERRHLVLHVVTVAEPYRDRDIGQALTLEDPPLRRLYSAESIRAVAPVVDE